MLSDPGRQSSVREVQYKGGELDAERGPGLGCFWIQVVLLVVLVVLTPLSVSWGWPPTVSAILLFVTIGITLFAGQTIIFLLRLVAADRRGRRRPLAGTSPTVGELEEPTPPTAAPGAPQPAAPATAGPPDDGVGGSPPVSSAAGPRAAEEDLDDPDDVRQ